MSFQVLVVPEDPTRDEYILRQVVETVVAAAGVRSGRIQILRSGQPYGYEAAARYCRDYLGAWRQIDLFLFMPDRDGPPDLEGQNRLHELETLESNVRDKGQWLLTCAAVEEVEVWMMAGHPQKLRDLGLTLDEVRHERKPSRGSCIRFLAAYGDRSPGEGRLQLTTEGVRQAEALFSRCGELGELVERIRSRDGLPVM